MPLDPQAKALLDLMNSADTPDMTTLEPAVVRQLFSTIGPEAPMQEVEKVENRTVPGPDGPIPLRIYTPTGRGPHPLLVFFHGGGWVIGSIQTHDGVCRDLALQAECCVVSVEYRLAPEAPYPAAPDDCYAVTRWIGEKGAELGVDPTRIAVGGDSAGGNLTAAVTLAARDRGGPRVAAQAIVYPGLRGDGTLPSFTTYADAPIQSTASTRIYRAAYMPDPATHDDPYACPLKADFYGDLPPALVRGAEMDAARDEGRVYAERRAAAGVDVTYRVAPRMIHSFMRARFNGPAARAEFDVICGFLARHLC